MPRSTFAQMHMKSTWRMSTLWTADVVFLALVAELRMLSSSESSAMLSSPSIVKSERQIKSITEMSMPSLLEPNVFFDEAYPDTLRAALKRLVFGQHPDNTDVYRWKSLGYWLLCQLASLSKSSDIFNLTFALKMITDLSSAFLENLHGIHQWYFVDCYDCCAA